MRKFLFLLLLILLQPFVSAFAESEPFLQVHQIDRGCADAYLFIHGDTAIIMDGGNDIGQGPDSLMDYLHAAGFKKLTAYIVTHYHDDHSANMNLILDAFGDDDTIILGPSRQMKPDYLPLPKGVYQPMVDGDILPIGALTFHCVGPRKVQMEGSLNADSLNVLLTYGDHKMLFTGDHTWSNNVLDKYPDLLRDIDVLKFPHHGLEPFSIGDRTFRQLNPNYILLPGSNSYKVLNFAKKNGFKGELIDNGDGNTVLLSNGREITVHTLCAPGQFAHY